jgi:6-phosphofructokinase 1
MRVAVSKRRYMDLEGNLWRDVLENTRQPVSMMNNTYIQKED